MRILLIEDDIFYANQVVKVLKERLDIDVDIIRSLKEYKQIEDFGKYKYILFDIYLEDCFDCGLIDEVVKTDIPVIVITSSEDLEIFNRYNQKKIIDYVIKNDMVRLEYLIMKLKILNFLEKYGILVVEDSKSYKAYISRFFKIYYPYANIMFAKDKKEALKILRKKDKFIKLIVTDYIVENGNTGLEVVKEIRHKYLFDDLAIIVFSSHDDKSIMARFLKAGVNVFLEKGFNNIEFVCRIDNVVKSLIQFEEIKSYSNKDYLTGCFNRRFFYDTGLKMYHSLKRVEKDISLAIFDLDHFKKLNDTYGHTTGDLILKHFANILQDSIRQSDFVVRYGGEEFLMFFSSCNKDMAKKIVEERIRKKVIDSVVEVDNKKIKYNFSCGICDTADSFQELIKKADEKLYKAKEIRGITVA